MAAFHTRPAQGILFFATGSSALCLLSTLQKIAVGTTLSAQGYALPFIFGGTTGMALGFSQTNLRERNEELQRAIAALQESNERLLHINETLEKRTADLEKAFTEIKRLQGIIPICAQCKKIRAENGTWQGLEQYVQHHSSAQFSHSLCPECAKALYPELNIIPFPETEKE